MDIRSFFFYLYFTFQTEPFGTPSFAASRLVLCCLSMSHKKDDRLIRVFCVFFFAFQLTIYNHEYIIEPQFNSRGLLRYGDVCT